MEHRSVTRLDRLQAGSRAASHDTQDRGRERPRTAVTGVLTRRQHRLIMGLFGVLLALGVTYTEPRPLRPVLLAVVALIAAGLLVLGLFPELGHDLFRVTAMAAASTALAFIVYQQLTVGVYMVILEATQRLRFRTALAVSVGASGGALVAIAVRDPDAVINVPFNAGFFACMFVLSYGARSLRDERQLSQALLTELETAREEHVEHARVSERAHLAREIHDVLAHSLTGLIVQLNTAGMQLQMEQAQEAAGSIERARHLAQRGLDEARRAVGTLRGHCEPGTAMLPRLVEEFRAAAGVECTYTVSGRPVPLPSAVEVALYRAAQEALTNVRKHADPDHVTVALRYLEGTVELTVEDRGPRRQAPSLDGAGYGLHGLRERAELLGGWLAIARTEQGFRLRLCLPA